MARGRGDKVEGVKCSKGHTIRYVANGLCVECRKSLKRNWTGTNEGKIKIILAAIKGRAKRLGVPFSLDIKDVDIPFRCPILGIPLEFSNKYGADNSPSIDRLVPEKGYVRGNIAFISNRANRIKNTATPEELRKIADWVEMQL